MDFTPEFSLSGLKTQPSLPQVSRCLVPESPPDFYDSNIRKNALLQIEQQSIKKFGFFRDRVRSYQRGVEDQFGRKYEKFIEFQKSARTLNERDINELRMWWDCQIVCLLQNWQCEYVRTKLLTPDEVREADKEILRTSERKVMSNDQRHHFEMGVYIDILNKRTTSRR